MALTADDLIKMREANGKKTKTVRERLTQEDIDVIVDTIYSEKCMINRSGEYNIPKHYLKENLLSWINGNDVLTKLDRFFK